MPPTLNLQTATVKRSSPQRTVIMVRRTAEHLSEQRPPVLGEFVTA